MKQQVAAIYLFIVVSMNSNASPILPYSGTLLGNLKKSNKRGQFDVKNIMASAVSAAPKSLAQSVSTTYASLFDNAIERSICRILEQEISKLKNANASKKELLKVEDKYASHCRGNTNLLTRDALAVNAVATANKVGQSTGYTDGDSLASNGIHGSDGDIMRSLFGASSGGGGEARSLHFDAASGASDQAMSSLLGADYLNGGSGSGPKFVDEDEISRQMALAGQGSGSNIKSPSTSDLSLSGEAFESRTPNNSDLNFFSASGSGFGSVHGGGDSARSIASNPSNVSSGDMKSSPKATPKTSAQSGTSHGGSGQAVASPPVANVPTAAPSPESKPSTTTATAKAEPNKQGAGLADSVLDNDIFDVPDNSAEAQNIRSIAGDGAVAVSVHSESQRSSISGASTFSTDADQRIHSIAQSTNGQAGETGQARISVGEGSFDNKASPVDHKKKVEDLKNLADKYLSFCSKGVSDIKDKAQLIKFLEDHFVSLKSESWKSVGRSCFEYISSHQNSNFDVSVLSGTTLNHCKTSGKDQARHPVKFNFDLKKQADQDPFRIHQTVCSSVHLTVLESVKNLCDNGVSINSNTLAQQHNANLIRMGAWAKAHKLTYNVPSPPDVIKNIFESTCKKARFENLAQGFCDFQESDWEKETTLESGFAIPRPNSLGAKILNRAAISILKRMTFNNFEEFVKASIVHPRTELEQRGCNISKTLDYAGGAATEKIRMFYNTAKISPEQSQKIREEHPEAFNQFRKACWLLANGEPDPNCMHQH